MNKPTFSSFRLQAFWKSGQIYDAVINEFSNSKSRILHKELATTKAEIEEAKILLWLITFLVTAVAWYSYFFNSWYDKYVSEINDVQMDTNADEIEKNNLIIQWLEKELKAPTSLSWTIEIQTKDWISEHIDLQEEFLEMKMEEKKGSTWGNIDISFNREAVIGWLLKRYAEENGLLRERKWNIRSNKLKKDTVFSTEIIFIVFGVFLVGILSGRAIKINYIKIWALEFLIDEKKK